MPKVNKKYLTASAPEIDWLWAAYLERKKVYGYDLKEMANVVGVEYGHMRQLERKSPWSWKKEWRDRMCNHFGIKLTIAPNVNGKIEVRIS